MQQVQGIGGVFLYARDAAALAGWYQQHFGLELQHWGDSYGCELPSRDQEKTGRRATTTFAIFPHDDPEAMGAGTVMLNFRVPDLDGLERELRSAGVRFEDYREDSAYGRFVRLYDGEGNRLELWQPPRLEEGWPG